MSNTQLVMILIFFLILSILLLIPKEVYRVLLIRRTSVSRHGESITNSMPLAMSVKKGDKVTITHASGSILSQFSDLIGGDPEEVLPIGLYNILRSAIEEGFDGRVTNTTTVINGASYNLSVKPIMGKNSVSEVVSIAVETSRGSLESVVQQSFNKDRMTIVIHIQIEGISLVEEAIGEEGTQDLLAIMDGFVKESVRQNDVVINMEHGAFVIFMPKIQQKEFANGILDSLLNKMSSTIQVAGFEITMPIQHKIMMFTDKEESHS